MEFFFFLPFFSGADSHVELLWAFWCRFKINTKNNFSLKNDFHLEHVWYKIITVGKYVLYHEILKKKIIKIVSAASIYSSSTTFISIDMVFVSDGMYL